jgi:hypothetical protein
MASRILLAATAFGYWCHSLDHGADEDRDLQQDE